MSPHTVRSLRRHAAVYLGLAATGAVIGWRRAGILLGHAAPFRHA
jgi:hypothetical protein